MQISIIVTVHASLNTCPRAVLDNGRAIQLLCSISNFFEEVFIHVFRQRVALATTRRLSILNFVVVLLFNF